MNNDKNKIDEFVEALKKGDAQFVAAQEQIRTLLSEGKTVEEIHHTLEGTFVDGLDVMEFLKQDTLGRRVDFILRSLM